MGEVIRIATKKDVYPLILIGEEFAYASQPAHGFSVDRLSIMQFANEVIENPAFVVLVLEIDGEIKGLLVAMINKIFFSEDVALQELVWYVKKGCRGFHMLKALEYTAANLNIKKIIIGNKPAFCDLGAAYERRGYRLLENQYIKQVE